MAGSNAKRQWLTYFLFNRTERFGIAVLILILVGVIALPYFFTTKTWNDKKDLEKFISDINRFENEVTHYSDSLKTSRQFNYQQMDRSMAEAKLQPFPFDPNNLPAEQWKKIGLKDWQIKTIKNFESKGGKFYSKEDVRKMYCLKPSEYEILEPFIVIPTKKYETVSNTPRAEKPTVEKLIIDLNTADSATLTSLYGIGPSFAKRILKYRNLLGGFYSKQQLTEVYGFDQSKLDQIANKITVSAGNIKKININTVKTDELKKHPYLDYYTAKAIVDRRISKGNYTSVEQLKEIELIHGDLYQKIFNYLSIK